MGIGTSDGEYYDDRLSHALASEPTREAQPLPEGIQKVFITKPDKPIEDRRDDTEFTVDAPSRFEQQFGVHPKDFFFGYPAGNYTSNPLAKNLGYNDIKQPTPVDTLEFIGNVNKLNDPWKGGVAPVADDRAVKTAHEYLQKTDPWPREQPTQLLGTPSYETKLTPEEESKFQEWKSKNAPKDSGQDYDLRGAFKAGVTPDEATGHWPDTFKKPNHPTFSDQSQYAKDRPDLAGTWDGDTYVPPKPTDIRPTPYGLNPPDRETPFPRPRASEVLGGFFDTVKKAFSLTEAPAWALDQTTGEYHTSPQAIERAADLAGLMTFGPAPVASKMAEGTLGSFAGVKSELFKNPATSSDMKAVLQHAQELEMTGASQDTIWNKTGFFKGADNRWRYEIPDKDMKLKNEAFLPTVNEAGKLEGITPKGQNPIYKPMKTLQDFKDSFNREKPLYLKDAIDHPKLFAAYPELKGVKVYELPKELNTDGHTKGMMWGNELYLAPGLPKDEARSIMMHEIQHRIQSIEGFASGGAPEMFHPKAWEGAMKEFETAKEWLKREVQNKGANEFMMGSLQTAIRGELDVGYKSLHPHYQKTIDHAKTVGLYQPQKNIIEAERLIDKATIEWHDKYKALMGEVEARNVQDRMDYDRTLRKLLPPGRTEKIPRFMQVDPKDLESSSVSKSTEPTPFRRAANDNTTFSKARDQIERNVKEGKITRDQADEALDNLFASEIGKKYRADIDEITKKTPLYNPNEPNMIGSAAHDANMNDSWTNLLKSFKDYDEIKYLYFNNTSEFSNKRLQNLKKEYKKNYGKDWEYQRDE